MQSIYENYTKRKQVTGENDLFDKGRILQKTTCGPRNAIRKPLPSKKTGNQEKWIVIDFKTQDSLKYKVENRGK